MTEAATTKGAGVLVFVFPGQGSLTPGVGVPWQGHQDFSVVDEVGALVGVDLARLLTTGTQDELVATEHAQLCTFALSLCVLGATGLAGRADYALGHSLGEYTALVAAGMLERDDASRLVAVRGRAMRAAADAAPGGLAALVGVGEAEAEEVCAAVPGLVIANLNGPGQVVVGGDAGALDALEREAKSLGVRRVIRLRVDGAFHTPLMAPAAEALALALESAAFRAGSARVLANVDGSVHEDPGAWPRLLVRQLTEPVRFEACARALPAGASVVECGPGRVLAGLLSRIRDDLAVVSIGCPEDLGAAEGLA